MSFIIKVFVHSDEDTILCSLYKDTKYCCKIRDCTESYAYYIFDSIDSYFAKKLLWKCNKIKDFDMNKVIIQYE